MKNIKHLFAAHQVRNSKSFEIANLVSSLTAVTDSVSSPLRVTQDLAAVVSNESFGQMNQEQMIACQDMFQEMQSHLESLGFESFNMNRGADAARINENQILAATLANMASTDEVRYKKALRGMTTAGSNTDPSVVVMQPVMAGPYGTINTVSSRGLENYNEKSQRDFRVISIAYNLSAARQDAFGEALYPTVVVNPTEGGVTQNLTYAAILKDVFHQTTGALFDAKEVNMVEAYRDPTVLEDASTAIVPIVNSDNSNLTSFVANADVAHVSVNLESGVSVVTAPLAIGRKIDLIGISNRQLLLQGNLMDISDTIDPALRLKAIYVKTGQALAADQRVIRFNVERMPTAVGQPALTGDTRQVNINFNTEDLMINGDTVAVDGAASTELTTIDTNGWTLRLAVGVSGTISSSKGDAYLSATPVVVEKIFDNTGQSLNLGAGAAAALLTALGQLTVIGYDLEARFTNTNRRERGQLVQTRTLQFRYPVPMHSPITLPMSTLDENGAGDVVKVLNVATNIRNSNNAVTRLLNYLSQLKEVVSAGYDRPKFGAVEGALSAVIRPTYVYDTLNLSTALDSIRAKDRWEDVCSVILDKIKSLLFPAYRGSNIEAAFQTITGNADERPKFIIATDKEIANYLMQVGDDRTLGSYLKYDIVSTNNEKMDGKIVVVPTRENPSEDDILNFGQFYFVPTVVADMPISRNGQTSREIAVVPFNLHVNNIPFAIEIDVTGLDQVMGSSVYNTIIAP